MFFGNHRPCELAAPDPNIRYARDLAPLGIGVGASCANDAAAYPQDGFDARKRLASAQGFRSPYLYYESRALRAPAGRPARPTPDCGESEGVGRKVP